MKKETKTVMKSYSRLMAIALTVVMLFSSITAWAAVDFDVNGTRDASIAKYFDFEDGNAWSGCSTNVVDTDEYHNKVLKITPTEVTSNAQKTIGTDSTKGAYMISFDYKASTTDHIYQMFFRSSGNVDFATMYFDHNGKIVVTKKYPKVFEKNLGPATLNNDICVTIGSYEANKWGNISAVVTTKDGKTTMDWFINGAHAFSTPELWGNGSDLAKVFIASTYTGVNLLDSYGPLTYDGTENLLIDNFKVSYVEEYSKFYATIASVKDNTVAVKFNETLAANNDLTGIKVKAIDGTVVETGTISFVGDTMYIPLTGTVKDGVEYAVVLPQNLSSVINKKIANNALYFSLPSEATPMPVYNKVATFDTGKDPTLQGVVSDSNISERFYGGDFRTTTWHGIKPHNFGDAEHNIVADINLQNDSVNTKSSIDDTSWFNIHNGVTEETQTDEEIFSMDIYFDELNEKTHQMILVAEKASTNAFNYDKDKMVATFTINANGTFIINDGTQSGKPVGVAELRTVGARPSATNDDFVVVPGVFTADKWYTLKMIVSKKAGKVKTYVGSKNVNGVYEESLISTTDVAYSAYDHIDSFYIADHNNTNYQSFYLDNLKYGYIHLPEVSAGVRSVRLIDASNEEFGTDSANIHNNINKIKAYYDCDVTEANFVSSGITLKNSKNEDIAVTASYDSTEKSVTATITNGNLPNGTYTVTINAVTGAVPYTATFTVNDTRKVEFKNFKLLKNGAEITAADDIVKGDTVSVVVDAKNEHWKNQKFNVILCEYSGGYDEQLEQVKFVEKTVEAGEPVSVTDGELQITTKSDDPIIKAFIWKDFVTVEPLVNHIYKYPNSGTVSCTSGKILYNGRFKLVEDGDSSYMQSNWQRANVRLKSIGNGVTLHFQEHNKEGVIKLYVNGELKSDDLAKKMYNADINISEFLSAGNNDILVTFASENMQRGFKGVTAAEGTWLDTPTPRDLNLMFIGPSTTSSQYGFALKLPLALNADFTNISRSAIALRDGRGPSYYNGMETMFDYYGSVNRGEDGQDVLLDTTPFDHVAVDKDKFDMIFVQIGINDGIGVLSDGSIETDGADRQDFYESYFAFVKKLRTLYPSAKIIMMSPFDTLDGSAAADYRRETFNLIDDDMLESEGLTEANGYYYISTSGWVLDYADTLHPSDAGHTTATEMILAILREKNLID